MIRSPALSTQFKDVIELSDEEDNPWPQRRRFCNTGLAPLGLEIHPLVLGGNCFFHAVEIITGRDRQEVRAAFEKKLIDELG